MSLWKRVALLTIGWVGVFLWYPVFLGWLSWAWTPGCSSMACPGPPEPLALRLVILAILPAAVAAVVIGLRQGALPIVVLTGVTAALGMVFSGGCLYDVECHPWHAGFTVALIFGFVPPALGGFAVGKLKGRVPLGPLAVSIASLVAIALASAPSLASDMASDSDSALWAPLFPMLLLFLYPRALVGYWLGRGLVGRAISGARSG